jgi:hypothetical protein
LDSGISSNNSQPLKLSANEILNDSTLITKKAAGSPDYKLAVTDVAANLGGRTFDALSANTHVTQISSLDGAPIPLTVQQLTSTDTAGISKLATGTTVNVNDTAVHVGGSIFDLLNKNPLLSKITVSDASPVNLSIQQLTNDTNALKALVAGTPTYAANVADLAANVGNAFDSLNQNGHISKITLTDPTTTAVPLSVNQLTNASTALNALAAGTPTYHVNVTDSGANLGNSTFDNLYNNTHVTAITVNDNTPVSLSASQLSTEIAKLAAGTPNYTVNLTDDASSLGGRTFDALSANTHVTQITPINGSITLSASQLTSDSSGLAKLAAANSNYQVNVSDTAASITSKLSTLSADLPHVGTINVSDLTSGNHVSFSDSSLTSYSNVLSHLPTGSVNITSTDASSFASEFSSIAANSAAINSINLSAIHTPITLTAEQFDTINHTVLSKIAGSLPTINVTDTLHHTTHTLTAAEIADPNYTVPCYVQGTHIETDLGLKLVEELKAGDLVLTVDGRYESVIWVGSRKVIPKFQGNKEKAYPVRIVKDAFGENLPQRDLLVSPDHSIYVDGLMIPAEKLINSKTIIQEKWSQVTYFHVELPKHEAIYAEGLPAESYLDTTETNRAFFNNSLGNGKVFDASQEMPAPKDVPLWRHIWDTQGYGKLTTSGPVLESVKARLNNRADEMTQKVSKAA